MKDVPADNVLEYQASIFPKAPNYAKETKSRQMFTYIIGTHYGELVYIRNGKEY